MNEKATTLDGIEGPMKRISQVLSAIGFGLMVTGLVLTLVSGASLPSVEASALGIFPLSAWTQASVGLVVTSVGIILLALLPIVRVLMALWLYRRGRNLLDVGATLIVFLELLVSILIGR
jgi:uncharacterized membrane protein